MRKEPKQPSVTRTWEVVRSLLRAVSQHRHQQSLFIRCILLARHSQSALSTARAAAIRLNLLDLPVPKQSLKHLLLSSSRQPPIIAFGVGHLRLDTSRTHLLSNHCSRTHPARSKIEPGVILNYHTRERSGIETSQSSNGTLILRSARSSVSTHRELLTARPRLARHDSSSLLHNLRNLKDEADHSKKATCHLNHSFRPPMVLLIPSPVPSRSLTQSNTCHRQEDSSPHPRRAQGFFRQRAYVLVMAELHRHSWWVGRWSSQLW